MSDAIDRLIAALDAQAAAFARLPLGALIGNWPTDMILLFNQIGDYCEREGLAAEDAEMMFNAGIAARSCGTLEQFRSVPTKNESA
jgi:hypothetical protein